MVREGIVYAKQEHTEGDYRIQPWRLSTQFYFTFEFAELLTSTKQGENRYIVGRVLPVRLPTMKSSEIGGEKVLTSFEYSQFI
jgi:hypothetical protein